MLLRNFDSHLLEGYKYLIEITGVLVSPMFLMKTSGIITTVKLDSDAVIFRKG